MSVAVNDFSVDTSVAAVGHSVFAGSPEGSGVAKKSGTGYCRP